MVQAHDGAPLTRQLGVHNDPNTDRNRGRTPEQPTWRDTDRGWCPRARQRTHARVATICRAKLRKRRASTGGRARDRDGIVITTNPRLVDQVESLIERCREGHLNRLVIELSRALQDDLAATSLVIANGGADDITTARESRQKLEWLVSIASETLREVADAPFYAKNGEVHAFGTEFTPGQVPGLVRRLVEAAYNAQQQVDYAVDLTRKALNAQPIVSIQ